MAKKEKDLPTFSLAAEKILTVKPAETMKVKDIAIQMVNIDVINSKITANTNLGNLVIKEGDDFPSNWAITKAEIEAKIKAQVAAGKLVQG